MMINNSAGDHRNIERHLASDARFNPRRDAFGQWRYDFDDTTIGDRRVDLLQFEALRLKNDLDAAAGRV